MAEQPDIPTQDRPVDLDLDVMERERGDIKPSLHVRVNGRVIEFRSPKEIDWVDLADLGDDPVEFVQLCCAREEDAAWLISQTIPSWKAEKMVEHFMQHFGISTRRGNRTASRR